MPRCLIDDTLSTALLAYPIAQGWVDAGPEVEVRRGVTAETVAAVTCPRLLDHSL